MLFVAFSVSGAESISAKQILSLIKSEWWFIKVYLELYILHPYLNMFLTRLTREEYKRFLITAFTCWSIIPLLTGWPFGASVLVHFVCLYSLAGYFRLWADDFGSRKFIAYGVLFVLADFLAILVMDFAGLKYPFLAKHALYFSGIIRPFTIIAALCFLLGFRKLEIANSRIINTIAGGALGVYMLHANSFTHPLLWGGIFRVTSFQNSPYLIPYSLAVILIVFISCTILELLRSRIFKTLSRGYLS